MLIFSDSMTKLFHVNLLKAWNEGEDALFDWDEKGRWKTKEFRKQIEEGIPISAWQTKQIDKLLSDFSDVFLDKPEMVQGVTHAIHTLLGVVVRVPAWRSPSTMGLMEGG